MDPRALHSEHLLAAGVFVASTLVLALQLINPSPVVVSVGKSGTEVAELGGYYRYRDVGIATVAACLLGVSGTYLLMSDVEESGESRATATDADGGGSIRPATDGNGMQAGGTDEPVVASESGFPDDAPDLDAPSPSGELLAARRKEWEENADRLANNEAEIYEVLLDADGVLPQSEIVDETDLSKATVSRKLDSLETKNLVERRRHGMGNVVLLR
jgi:uncharacterized membrane protein